MDDYQKTFNSWNRLAAADEARFMNITHHSNHAARKNAKKSGFIPEVTLRSENRISEGKLIEVLYYGLLPSYK